MSGAWLDCAFALTGSEIPVDHGYSLFAALTRALPAIRDGNDWAVHPVAGRPAGNGTLLLTRGSTLTLRVPTDDVGVLLPLVGQTLRIDGHAITIGVPRLWPLQPHERLWARFVTIARVLDVRAPEVEQSAAFLRAVVRRLAALDLSQDADSLSVTVGHRHVMRIGSARPRVRSGRAVVDRDIVVGFEIRLERLAPESSLLIQRVGLGGRRRMGAGVFSKGFPKS